MRTNQPNTSPVARFALDGHEERERRSISAQVCELSQQSLQAIARRFGLSITALLDLGGHLVLELNERSDDELRSLFPGFDDLVAHGRAIDAARRSRANADRRRSAGKRRAAGTS